MEDLNNSIDFSKKISELGKLSTELSSASPDEFRKILTKGVCSLLDVPICILWEKELEGSKFKIVAHHGDIDNKYQRLELDSDDPTIKHNLLRTCKVWSARDLDKVSHRFVHRDEIKARNWVSIMSATLKSDGGNPIGILDVYTTEKYSFQFWEKDLFGILGSRIAMYLEKNKLLNEYKKSEADRKRSRDMTDRMRKMNNAKTSEDVWDLLNAGVAEILENDSKGEIHIEVGEIDRLHGKVNIIKKTERKNYDVKLHLQLRDEGIISKAIRGLKTVLENHDASKDYVDLWEDARSEVAIPLVEQVQIREGTEVKTGFKKCIGIICIASSSENAFIDRHIRRIELLASHASNILEKIDSFEKNKKIRGIERQIAQNQDYEFIMEQIIEGIKILEFEWINISLVNTKTKANTIESKYVYTTEKDFNLKRFKKDANHLLEGTDIQARIVKNKQIEVPGPEDIGFDSDMYTKYGHDRLIRVFLPIIEPSTNQAIGTIEAGYQRKFRQHIYEQDVILLKSFVDDAAHAIERKKSKLIDRITHELKSPIVGIRANASFIQLTFDDIRYNRQRTVVKMEDILTDCDLLLYQVRQLEYFLGRGVSSEKTNLERIFVFRDIILKTINELSYYMKDEYNFSVDKIQFDRNLIQKIIVRTDKAKLNQVVFNLLINSLKYAKSEPADFKVSIDIEESKDNFIVKFRDWGIGINEEDRKKLFNEGFRSEEAIVKVGGSGLGLFISKSIMKQLGGDLELYKNREPTEFHLTLPKNTRQF